jgi:hypothetical protein
MAFHDHPEVSTANLRGSLEEGVRYMVQAVAAGRTVSGHNVIRHDIPLIAKFFSGFYVHPDQVLDTLVVSRLIWTDLEDIDHRALKKGKRPAVFREKRLMGKHSLEAWGYRLGFLKGDFHGPWDTFTPEMADYGIQDPEVTLKLVEKIEEQNYSEEAIRLEHRVAEIIFLAGAPRLLVRPPCGGEAGDRADCRKGTLRGRTQKRVQSVVRARALQGEDRRGRPQARRTAAVTAETGETWRASYEPGEPYCKVKLVSFEPGSRDKIANRLKTLFGWTPVDFTPTGKPKVDETTLGGLDYPEAKLLVRYLTVDKRSANSPRRRGMAQAGQARRPHPRSGQPQRRDHGPHDALRPEHGPSARDPGRRRWPSFSGSRVAMASRVGGCSAPRQASSWSASMPRVSSSASSPTTWRATMTVLTSRPSSTAPRRTAPTFTQ